MRTLFLLAFTAITLASACNKKVTGNNDGRDGLATTSKAAKVIQGLEDNSFDAEYLEGSARVKLESEKLNIGGSATIRLHKDKAIWMSVKKFGFEGARALIRPDSFFVINRLNGDYTAEPLSYIEEKYKVPARFDLLQEIVLGNAVFFTRDLKLQTEGDTYTLSGHDSRFATRHTVDANGFRLMEMTLNELAQNRTLSISNADFRKALGKEDGPDFAFERTVSIDAKATGPAKLDLTFNRLKFEGPLAMPFERR
ncbi:DUF4292 domain-containing protein [Neolewinella aurantiaca]|nr:DUF4292 domain-containing protein [Neolewinella aurantiaca]